MMTLLWKVGNTYHLCGEGGHESSYASLAGDYLKMFLPIVDINEGPRFVARDGSLAGAVETIHSDESEDGESTGYRDDPVLADEEPPLA